MVAVAVVASSTHGERGAASGEGDLDQSTIDDLRSLAAEVTIPLVASGCDRTMLGNSVVIDGDVITNRHLVNGAAGVSVGSQLTVASIEVGSSGSDLDDLDLAMLRVTSRRPGDRAAPVRGARLAAEDPPPAAPVLVAAWIDGSLRTVAGRVHAYTAGQAYGSGLVMLLEPAVDAGFSGGTIFDSEGNVVGLVRAFESNTSLTVAVPASDIHAWRTVAKAQVISPSCG